MRAIPIEIADEVVAEVHAPIKGVLAAFDKVAVPDTVAKVAQRLEARAAAVPDAAQAAVLTKMAEKVRAANTVGDLNRLKIYANKEAAKLFDKTLPGKVAESQATSVWGYRNMADDIRVELYPELERRGVSGLAARGRLEAQALDARDGVYASWAEAARENAPAALQSWFQKFAGHFAGSSVLASPTRAAIQSAAKTMRGELPLGTFNRLFRDALGGDIGPFNPPRVQLRTTPQSFAPQPLPRKADWNPYSELIFPINPPGR
jgi:hypothetical protein